VRRLKKPEATRRPQNTVLPSKPVSHTMVRLPRSLVPDRRVS
jgi:hypothetical protein